MKATKIKYVLQFNNKNFKLFYSKFVNANFFYLIRGYKNSYFSIRAHFEQMTLTTTRVIK